jgi:ureidoglycolate hydrolase
MSGTLHAAPLTKQGGRQGINHARNVWHHPLLVLNADCRFLVVDRKGPGNNLEEVWFGEREISNLALA